MAKAFEAMGEGNPQERIGGVALLAQTKTRSYFSLRGVMCTRKQRQKQYVEGAR